MRTLLPYALLCLALFAATPASAQGYPTPPEGYPSQGYPTPLPEAQAPVPTRTAALVRTLDDDLELLAAQGDGRVLDGSLQLVAGAAFVGIGFLVDDELFRSILFLTGSISVARGVVELAVAPDTVQPAVTYRHMPMVSAADVRARLAFGERALHGIARRTRTARILDGTLTMAGAAAYVPLYWALQRANDANYRFGDDPVDYLGLTLSGIAFAAGLVTALRPSGAERRAEAYDRLKERFARESPGEFAFRPQFGVAVSPHGARASVVVSF